MKVSFFCHCPARGVGGVRTTRSIERRDGVGAEFLAFSPAVDEFELLGSYSVMDGSVISRYFLHP